MRFIIKNRTMVQGRSPRQSFVVVQHYGGAPAARSHQCLAGLRLQHEIFPSPPAFVHNRATKSAYHLDEVYFKAEIAMKARGAGTGGGAGGLGLFSHHLVGL